ncbi:MAG TPA: M48 family metallopeptidase [Terracidiphilus sp.]|nr:M48 family metallopeptidase [Terracidiphilus sp.]
MENPKTPLPERQWSIVALGALGVATVVLSYVLAIVLAIVCLLLPVPLLLDFGLGDFNLIAVRVLLSAFGIAAGSTICWSLVPRKHKVQVNGVLIDVAKEKRLVDEIESIAAALDEPMPTEVYLIGDANAYVVEEGRFFGSRRRIIALGLPLLQMLSIAQFRAVLAHEFAHYYAGDTRLGPWVYNARTAILRVYENLGRKSEVIRFLRRWAVVSIAFSGLMAAMRAYWTCFMRVTQWISRRQEYRCDELACYVAGSRSLADGLAGINRCSAALNAYWNSVVLPVAVNGFQPPLASGFMQFMDAPAISKATDEYMAKMNEEKPSPLDTHPPMRLRIERANSYGRQAPGLKDAAVDLSSPMVSLIDDLSSLEAALLKKLLPNLANTPLKTTSWETAAIDVFVPAWKKRVAPHQSVLSSTAITGLHWLASFPDRISRDIPNPPGNVLNQAQRDGMAIDVLRCALALCLIENGWTLVSRPGVFYFENGSHRLVPGEVVPAMRTGKLSAGEWQAMCSEKGLCDWPLLKATASDLVPAES